MAKSAKNRKHKHHKSKKEKLESIQSQPIYNDEDEQEQFSDDNSNNEEADLTNENPDSMNDIETAETIHKRNATPATDPQAIPTAFAKRLAHNDKKIRDLSIKRLKQWLQKRVDVTEDDMLKIWRGLFYCKYFYNYLLFCFNVLKYFVKA